MTKIDTSIIPPDVIALCTTLQVFGYHGWIVGGCTRDMILGRVPSDWDVATDALPEQVMTMFAHVIPTGLQHGTVTVRINEVNYEVTTLRGEGKYTDGRRPDDVRFVNDIVEDLARRDFTMNAIAFDPIMNELIDPFGGIADIAARKIKAVGVALERFKEDGLRIMRAARFCSTLEFDLDPETEAAIAPARMTYLKVSMERIRDELTKIMKSSKPSLALHVMVRTGLFDDVFDGVMTEEYRNEVFQYFDGTFFIVDEADRDLCHRLATLLVFMVDRKVNIAEKWLERLRFSKNEQERVTMMLKHFETIFYPGFNSEGEARRFAKLVTREHITDVIWLTKHLRKWNDNGLVGRDIALLERVLPGAILTTKELAINGTDLMKELKMKPGPELGRTLNLLLNIVLENPLLNTRDGLLTMCKGDRTA
jgi:tRNA nucleotidyltransferase (CCA-adding enzyme)